MRWIELVPSTHELPAGMTADEWHGLVGAAVSSWNDALAGCGGLHLAVKEPTAIRLAQEDGQTVLVFRQKDWCHNGRCGPGTTFSLGTMAMTTTFPDGARGKQIREADVEINGKALRSAPSDARDGQAGAQEWRFVAPGGQRSVSLQTVLEHEIGHVLGLRDGCSGKPRMGAADRAGCQSEVSMLPATEGAGSGSVAKAHSAAVCALHGARSGCDVGGGGGVASGHLGPLLVLLLVLARRRIGGSHRFAREREAHSARSSFW
jgi:hypothetical protein